MSTSQRAGRGGATGAGRRSGPPRWYARPALVLPIVGVLVVVVAVLTPERAAGRSGDPRLSTYSSQPLGAQLFHDAAGQLGWRVERRDSAEFRASPTTVQALLAPSQYVRHRDIHALLEHVRAGGALLVVPRSRGDAILDSLRLTVRTGADVIVPPGAADSCTGNTQRIPRLWPSNRAHMLSLRWSARPPAQADTFLAVRPLGSRGPQPAMIGFALGRGRVVVGSDPDLFRNDALRVCEHGLAVPAFRALEFLRDGGDAPRTHVVFDEYHHGFGDQRGAAAVLGGYLFGTASGRTLSCLAAAGLVLLFAAAPRDLIPRHREVVQRRSPLEHVDALARAYAQVGGTRTATGRLVRGLRRRIERGTVRAARALADDAFLARLADAAPATAADAATVRRALAERVSAREFVEVGHALERIEHTLTRT